MLSLLSSWQSSSTNILNIAGKTLHLELIIFCNYIDIIVLLTLSLKDTLSLKPLFKGHSLKTPSPPPPQTLSPPPMASVLTPPLLLLAIQGRERVG